MTNIIAEVGSSHNGSKDTALELIKVAAEAGCDWVKFQLFSGDDLWYPGDERLQATRKLALPETWLPDLKKCAEDHGIKFLCTPFSIRAVNILRDLGVEAYKISSGDLTYIPLIEEIGKTEKLVFLSVGGGTLDEINTALWAMPVSEVVLLHCVPGYPTTPANAHLPHMLDLAQYYMMHSGWTEPTRQKFGDRTFPVGLSSHLREYYVDAASVLYNAHTIEKHIDLPGRPGPEGPHSLDPDELNLFVMMVKDMEQARKRHLDGNYDREFTEDEIYARENYRRGEDGLRPTNEAR